MRHVYRFFELQLKKLNKNSKFLFKFNIVDDNEDADVFQSFNVFKNHLLKITSLKNYCRNVIL